MKKVIDFNEKYLKNVVSSAMIDSIKKNNGDVCNESEVISSVDCAFEESLDEGVIKNFGRAALLAGTMALTGAGMSSCTNDKFMEP